MPVSIANGNLIDADTVLRTLSALGYVVSGADASKAAVPAVGQVYIATDTRVLYICYVAGTWTAVSDGIAATSSTQVLAGNIVLTDASPRLLYLDANGANRNVTLPAEATTNHPFVIINTAGAAYNLVVKDDAAVTIITVTQGQTGLVWSNGIAWKGFISMPSLSTLSNFLGGNVNLTNAGTYYDGPSVTLTDGIWLLTGCVVCQTPNTTGDVTFTGKLYNAGAVISTALNGTYLGAAANTLQLVIPLSGIVTIVGSVATKIAVTANVNTCIMVANVGALGNYASYLFAVKIG